MPDQNKMLSNPAEALKTGEIMVKEGLIRFEDIDRALSLQKKKPTEAGLGKSRLFGTILCNLNLVNPTDNYCVLHKYKKLLSLQTALVSRNIVSAEVAQKTLKESQNQDYPFISSLIDKKLVSVRTMQTLLFDLFHIPFRSISDFIFNETDRTTLVQVLDKATSMEKKILPMIIKNNTILFGITDPENLVFIRKLNSRFVQYRFKTLFIPFSGFSWFYRILYEGKNRLPDKKPLDLSLLLGFKLSIQDPEKEKDTILSLYHRYEQLRLLTGNPERHHLENKFIEFITFHHRKLTLAYQCRRIDFFFQKNESGVKLIAFPKRSG